MLPPSEKNKTKNSNTYDIVELSHTHKQILSFSLPLSFSLNICLSHINNITMTLTHSHSLSHEPPNQPLSMSWTRTHALFHWHTHTFNFFIICTHLPGSLLYLSLTNAHTHTHTHSCSWMHNTHTHAHARTKFFSLDVLHPVEYKWTGQLNYVIKRNVLATKQDWGEKKMKDHFRFESLPLFAETLKTVICFSRFFASPSTSATTVDESSTGFWSKVFPSPLNWKNI